MRKSTLIYLIYTLASITLTVFLSLMVISGKFTGFAINVRHFFFGQMSKESEYKIYELPQSVREENLNETSSMGCKPCEKVGEELPRCPLASLEPGHEQIYDGNWICIPATEIKITMEAHKAYMHQLMKKDLSEIWDSAIKDPLADLANIANKKRIEVLILLLRYNYWEKSLLEKIADKYGWNIIDFEFNDKYKPSDLVLDEKKDQHPNSFAHKLIAEEIYEYLVLNDFLPKPRR